MDLIGRLISQAGKSVVEFGYGRQVGPATERDSTESGYIGQAKGINDLRKISKEHECQIWSNIFLDWWLWESMRETLSVPSILLEA